MAQQIADHIIYRDGPNTTFDCDVIRRPFKLQEPENAKSEKAGDAAGEKIKNSGGGHYI